MRRTGFGLTITLALAVTACSGGAGNDTTLGSTTGALDDASLSAPAAGGLTLTYPDGTAVAFTATEIVEPAVPLPAGFTPAGAGYDIVVADGAIVDTATITLPGAAPPAGATPVLLHLNDLGEYEPNAATYTNGVYSANVSTFSPHIFGWFVDIIDSAVDYLTGRTDYPTECNTDKAHTPYPWVTATTGPPDGTYHACVYANPDPVTGAERVEVRIKSNRSMAQWVVLPSHPANYFWLEGGSDWSAIGQLITELDDDSNMSRVLLPPGRTLTLGYLNPGEVPITLQFSTYQNNTSQVASLAYKYLGDQGMLGLVLVMMNCLGGASTDLGTGTHFSDLSVTAAVDCLPDVARDLAFDGATATPQAVAAMMTKNHQAMIAAGRLQLSQGATDNIVQMIDDTTEAGKNARIARGIGTAAGILAVAPLLADATSMLTDALLASTPGINTYTVNLLGTPAPATNPAPPAAHQLPEGIDPAFVSLLLEVLGANNVTGITPNPDGYATVNYEALDGPNSTDTIATIQTINGLSATGIIDTATWNAIIAAASERTELGTCDGLFTRPTDFQLTCGTAFTAEEGVVWSQWSPLGAVGTGTARNPCPNYECADGGTYEWRPSTLEVRAPIRFNCGDSDPVIVFTEMTSTIGEFEPRTFQLDPPVC